MQLDLTMIISDGSEFRVNAGSAEQGWQSRGGGGGGGRETTLPLSRLGQLYAKTHK